MLAEIEDFIEGFNQPTFRGVPSNRCSTRSGGAVLGTELSIARQRASNYGARRPNRHADSV